MGTPGQKWCDAVTFCGTTPGIMTFGWTVIVGDISSDWNAKKIDQICDNNQFRCCSSKHFNNVESIMV
jgi:hypothetical protein